MMLSLTCGWSLNMRQELQRRCLEQLEAGLDTVHPVSTSTSQLLEELRWIMDLQNADGAQEQILQVGAATCSA
jgi:hypothetical protein